VTDSSEPGGGTPVPAAAAIDGSDVDSQRQVPVFRLFGFFFADTSLLRRFRFQLVVVLRFLSEIGQESVFYASLVQVATDGTPFQASVIGAAKVLPGALLGLFGGAVADAMPRRVGLGLGYAVQASLCVIIPVIFGTDFTALLILVLGVSTLNQFIGPSEKAVLPLISKREEISTAASLMSLSDSIATGIGTAMVAPIILVVFGVKTVFYISAIFLILASIRIFALPIQKDITTKAALARLHLSEIDLGFRKALSWLLGWPAIISMIMVGMVVSVLSNVTETLGPSYVSEVLHADPAKTIYVFAPAGLGALVALMVAPKLLNKKGERWVAAVAVLIMSVALFTMAFMEQLTPFLAPISPMNVVKLFGFEPTDELLAASFVSVFTGFAVSMSSVAVQTYVNKRVPNVQQGRVFGLQSVLVNAAALVPMLLLGALASVVSIPAVLFFAPWVVLGAVYALLVLSGRWMGVETMSRGEVMDSFWHEPGGPGSTEQPPVEPAAAP